MKTFKNIETFEKKLKEFLCWEDYFKVAGRTFKMYEYGDIANYNYVYFYNKFSGIMLYIKYFCPSYGYINGKRVQKKQYAFIKLEIIEHPDLWRYDTL